MKILNYMLLFALAAGLTLSCRKGLDPITSVSPRPDQSSPTLVIDYPQEGKVVRSPDEVATVVFKVMAEDDIELKSVVLQLDGTEIASITSFKDYRRAVIDFTYNNLVDGEHTLTAVVTDLTDKSETKTVNFKKVTAPPYTPLAGEVLYLPFDGDFLDLISGNAATVIGAPGFAEGKAGDAYSGATDAYLEFPTGGIVGSEFSLSFWYKINAVPLRAGLFSISPTGDSRNTGFRFLRENNGDNQNLGINFGIGETEVWMNPFITVPTTQDWMHIAITISTTLATIYVDGEAILETEITAPLDWTGCPSLSIGSGMPNFSYWEHFSDLSLYDELHMFNRAITAAEVQSFYSVK